MKFLLFIFVGLILVSCNDADDKASNNIKINKNSKGLSSHDFPTELREGSVVINSSGVTSHLSKVDGQLIYYPVTGKSVLINEDLQSKKYWLISADKYVYVFWWVKFDKANSKTKNSGKALYVKVSNNGGESFSDAYKVNSSSGVLPDLHVEADAEGHITVVYSDERLTGYQIYTNSSLDGGKTWLEHDYQLNQVSVNSDKNKLASNKSYAVMPSLRRVENKITAIWEQIEVFGGKKAVSMVSRSSLDFGQTWQDLEIIYKDFEKLSIEIASAKTDKEIYLFAVLDQGTAMFWKEGNGKWQRYKGFLAGTEKKDTDLTSYFKTAFDDSFLYVTFIAVEGHQKTDNHTEIRVFNRKNKKWERRARFDSLSMKKESDSRGYYQDIEILDDGTIIVVWEDYRGILPGILMTYSIDQARTWAKPILLNKVGLEHATFPYIKARGNYFSVFYRYYILANAVKPIINEKVIYLRSPQIVNYASVDFQKSTQPKNSKVSKQLVSARVNKLMTLRETKTTANMENEWGHFDPIFKNLTPLFKWMNSRNMLDYTNHKIENIEIKGAIATVTVKITYSMNDNFPPAKINKDLKKQKTEVSQMKWGWFYDGWYLIADNPKQSYLP